MSLPFLFGLSALLHLYVGMRLVPALHWPWPAAAVAVLLMAGALSMPMGLVARRFTRGPWADTLAWTGLLFMGLFSSLFVATLVREVVLLAAWLAGAAMGWRETTAVAVLVLSGLATLVGYLNARRTAKVVTVEVAIDGLPAALQGFTIVQISDIHVGPTIKQAYLDGIVDAVNGLQPDVVAITGDLVDGSVAELASHVAPLARLQSREGSFFVTGNHEYYSGAHAWIAELQRLGVKVLLNRHVVIERGDARLVLAGIPDYSGHHYDPAHKGDPAAALQGAPANAAARILLAHQPRSAPGAQQAGFDLQLSGHTHGGQFWPWNHFVRFQQPYTAGLHKLSRMWVYVSRGTGYWGPPKRLGAPSEITRIRLVSASA